MRDDYPPKAEALARRFARVSAVLELLEILTEVPSPPAWVAAAKAKAEARLAQLQTASDALAKTTEIDQGE